MSSSLRKALLVSDVLYKTSESFVDVASDLGLFERDEKTGDLVSSSITPAVFTGALALGAVMVPSLIKSEPISLKLDLKDIEDTDEVREEYTQPAVRQYEGQRFDVSKAVKYITDNARPYSTGMCAMHVRKAMQAGGLNVDDRPGYGGAYAEYLPKKGWFSIPIETAPQPGDIMVTLPFSNNKNHRYGHIAMWNGQNWVSDFVQSGIDVYVGSGGTPESAFRMFRFGTQSFINVASSTTPTFVESVSMDVSEGGDNRPLRSTGVRNLKGGKRMEAFIQEGSDIYSGNAKGINYTSWRTKTYHNLGNLTYRKGSRFYEGQVGYEVMSYKNDSGKSVQTRFAVFSDPYYALKAAYLNSPVGWPSKRFEVPYSKYKAAYNYIIAHGKRVPPNKKTLYRVMSHYAPYGDLNDPLSYAQRIANDNPKAWPSGVDTLVDLKNSKAQFISFFKIVSLHEQGTTVSESYLSLVYDAIFNGGPIPLQQNLNVSDNNVVLNRSLSYADSGTFNNSVTGIAGNVQVK